MVRGGTPNEDASESRGPRNRKHTKSTKRHRVQAQDIRVLVVDDHPIIRHGVRAALRVHGIRVVGEAVDGHDAVRQARELRPDIVVMDLRLPGLDGVSATQALRQEVPEAAVLVYTFYATSDQLKAALHAGASGFLAKDVSSRVLIRAIRMMRDGGSVIQTDLLRAVLGTTLPASKTVPPSTGLAPLTSLESRVLCGLVQGFTNKQIAQQLEYSLGSVKNAVQRILGKLDVSDRTGAAVVAVKAGFHC